MRCSIPKLLAVAAALPAVAAVRLQVAQKSAVEEFREICGGGAPPKDLVERGLDCDPEIPRYDMDAWMAEHGNKAPDHPAIFVNTHTKETEVFPDMETFLAKHGDFRVTALPEYATSGSALKHPLAMGKVTASFKELETFWNDTFVYFSDFKCQEDSLCHQVAKQFGIPRLFQNNVHSRNFLVGGPDSGLPFHKHGMTWQGLSMGRKAWYLLPPGSMTEEMHDMTGPYIFPVRSYHGLMQQRRLGARPFYCVQRPGDVLFVPEFWWHSTMNLDRYQVAYGEKPIKQIQPHSKKLDLVLSYFPPQAYDSAGFSYAHGGGETKRENPMPYTLMARQEHLRTTCAAGEIDRPTDGLELPMARMQALKGSALMRCGLAQTAAFAHCMMASWLGQVASNCSELDQATRQRIYSEVAEHAQRWKLAALELSPSLVKKEPGVCSLKQA